MLRLYGKPQPSLKLTTNLMRHRAGISTALTCFESVSILVSTRSLQVLACLA